MNSGARFLHLDNQRLDHLLQEQLLVGGYYNWHRAFGGDLLLSIEGIPRLGQYDIVFVPITGYNLQGRLISRIRDNIGDKVKIVTCVDYAWQLWMVHIPAQLHHLRSELLQADLVFSPTPAGVSYPQALSERLNVKVIPHPINVGALQQRTKKIKDRSDELLILLHRYDSDWTTPWLATKTLRHPVHVFTDDKGAREALPPYFQSILSRMPFGKFVDTIANKYIVLDSQNLMSTLGRIQIECACFGVPVVGSSNVAAQTDLWPELTTEPGDPCGQRNIIEHLYESKGFYRDVTESAYNKVYQDYSYRSCVDKMIAVLNEGQENEIEIQSTPATVS